MPTLDVALESRQAELAAQRLRLAMRGITDANLGTGKSLDQVDRKLVSLRQRLLGTGQAADSAGKRTRQLTRSLSVLGGFFGAISAARGAVTTIRDFEQSLAVLNAVAVRTTNSLGVQQQQMEALARTAREVGATTRFSATEAADGLLNLARAGLDANQAIAAIRPTLNLAQVGLLEVGEAGDVVTNVMSQFGLAAADLERVTDALVNTSNNANTNVQQLAQALVYVGPVAAKANLSLEETTALLGTLADNGIKGTLAGTQLRQVILTLQDPSSEAAAALARMGKNVEDLRPSSQSLIQTFKELGAANLDLSRASEVFETRSVAAALQLATNTQKTDELIEAQQRLQGRSEEIARTMDNTLAGAFKTLSASIEAVVLDSGDAGLTGALKDVVGFLTQGVRALTDYEEGMTGTAAAARGLIIALGAAGLAGTLVGLATFIGPTGLIVAGLAAAAGALFGWGERADQATLSLKHLRREFSGFADDIERATKAIEEQGRAVAELASIQRENALARALKNVQRRAELGGTVSPEEVRRTTGLDLTNRALIDTAERLREEAAALRADRRAGPLFATRPVRARRLEEAAGSLFRQGIGIEDPQTLIDPNRPGGPDIVPRLNASSAIEPITNALINEARQRAIAIIEQQRGFAAAIRPGGFSGVSGPPLPPGLSAGATPTTGELQGPDLNGQLRDAAVFAEYARQVDDLARSAANAKEIEEGRNRAIQDSIYALERQTEQVARSLARPIVDGIYAGLRDENPGEAILRGLTDAAVGNAGQIVENVLTQQLAKVGLVQQTAAVQLSTSVVSSAATFSGTVVSAGLAFAAAVSGGGSPSYLSTAARGILAGGGAGASTTGGSAVGGEFVVTRPTQLVQNGRAVGEIGEEGPESVSVTPGTRGARGSGGTVNYIFTSRRDASMRLTRDQLAGNDRRRLIRNSDR